MMASTLNFAAALKMMVPARSPVLMPSIPYLALFGLLVVGTAACTPSDVPDNAQPSAAEALNARNGATRADAAAGDLNARYVVVLGDYWEAGRYTEAIPHLEALALEGSTGAAHQLADAYARGIGVEADLTQAARWLGVAAEHGSEAAAQQLATYEQSRADSAVVR